MRPGEQQDGESAKAYAHFCKYRAAGLTREVRAVYRQAIGKPEASQGSSSIPVARVIRNATFATQVRQAEDEAEARLLRSIRFIATSGGQAPLANRWHS